MKECNVKTTVTETTILLFTHLSYIYKEEHHKAPT